MEKADLHLHSTASDGKMTPVEVVEAAASLNLAVISLTDHDTIAGIEPAQKIANGLGIELLTGVEITSSFNNRESHLLAYGFAADDKHLNELLKDHKDARVKRAIWIIKQLCKEGLELDIDEVLAEANSRNVGRPHIAAILVKKGYVANSKEAFIRYLSDDALGTIKSNYRDYKDVIAIVKQAGGVIILAHPGRLYTSEELLQFAAAKIDGLEALHPSHNYEIQKEMETFAKEHNLLTSGGSDFHGKPKAYYRHFGTLTINLQWVDKIKALTKRRKKYIV